MFPRDIKLRELGSIFSATNLP